MTWPPSSAKTVATSWAVPLISRLVRKTGNHGKLTGARVLLRVVRGLFGHGRLLLDTWFMRASVITFALTKGSPSSAGQEDLAVTGPRQRATSASAGVPSMARK